MKDPADALIHLIVQVEAIAKPIAKTKHGKALLASCKQARRHLPTPARLADDLSQHARKRVSERAHALREAAAKHLTTPMSELELDGVLDFIYGEEQTNVVELFPRKPEDPIARAVRIAKQLEKPRSR